MMLTGFTLKHDMFASQSTDRAKSSAQAEDFANFALSVDWLANISCFQHPIESRKKTFSLVLSQDHYSSGLYIRRHTAARLIVIINSFL